MGSNFPIIIKNSPIEFVVSGPARGRDRILIRSETAGLDLVALSMRSEEDAKDYNRTNPASVLFSSARQLNIVTSIPMADIEPTVDSRKSRINFAWKGLASSSGVNSIRKSLNLSLSDLYNALEENDKDEVELVIAPIVLDCTEAHEKRLRAQRLMLFALASYIVVIIIVLQIYPILINILRP